MTVCPMPAPWRVRYLLVIVRFVVQLHDPAGMTTVSPSPALAVAAATSAPEHDAALMVLDHAGSTKASNEIKMVAVWIKIGEPTKKEVITTDLRNPIKAPLAKTGFPGMLSKRLT